MWNNLCISGIKSEHNYIEYSVVICRTNINIFTRRDRPFLHISVFKRERARARCLPPHHYNCVFLALAYNKLILYTALFGECDSFQTKTKSTSMWHRIYVVNNCAVCSAMPAHPSQHTHVSIHAFYYNNNV